LGSFRQRPVKLALFGALCFDHGRGVVGFVRSTIQRSRPAHLAELTASSMTNGFVSSTVGSLALFGATDLDHGRGRWLRSAHCALTTAGSLGSFGAAHFEACQMGHFLQGRTIEISKSFEDIIESGGRGVLPDSLAA
jgi:hypothetical protein